MFHAGLRAALVPVTALVALSALVAPGLASVDNPYADEQARLAAETLRRGRAPDGVLPLLELWSHWDNAAPEVSLGHLRRVAESRRLAPPLRVRAQYLLALARLRMGDPAASRARLDELGYLRAWRVVGPFDNEGKAGFFSAFPPETSRMGPLDDGASYPGREREVSWRAYPDVRQDGLVSFDAIHRPRANVCSYAETFVESERAQPLTLWVGAGGAVKVWWNGEEVHADEAYRRPFPDRSVAAVGAHRGLNRLLVKACVTGDRWGFYLRVGAADGGVARGIRATATVDADAVAGVAPGHGAARRAAPTAARDALREAAEAQGASAQALYDYAVYLAATEADDPAEERARQLAARAAADTPTVERLTLAAALARQRGEARELAAQALELAPTAPEALLLFGRVASGGPSPEDALPVLERIERGSIEWMEASLLAGELLKSLGLPHAARRRVEEAAALAPRAPRWVGARASAAGATEHVDEMIALRRELLELRHDDLGARAVVMDDAVTRGATDEALAHLAVYRDLSRGSALAARTVARVLVSLARVDQALATLREGLEVAPEDAGLLVAQGRLLLRMDQRDAAADALREALALRPQAADTRELLEQIVPQERPDEAYATAPEELLARRGPAEGYPLRVLTDLTVNTVFESGLGSTFRQVAVQVQDDEGARRWRSYSIQFDPDVQRVDLRQARVFREGRQLSSVRTFVQTLGEPWYRIYYDTRAVVVVFPDLEPGDVVEIQYRVDDVAPRNLFDDYYGDIHYLQQAVPVASLDYVLITPRSRTFFVNEPEMEGLQHEQRDDGDRRIDHFHVEDIAPIRVEPNMAGLTEVVPYLHVSTYRTWEEVGRWYWGLLQDQLYADEGLRDVVRELLDGASDTRTKVQRIYDWVIRNTRYVALEFGIHGYLPYRVPDVVDRGFGDCKDKASLIYTMLREAGIEARIVLVRTRRNGRIRDLPASLAVFDHAIAYVPELDLYLDGTAEFTGITEFPAMDQGVTVLQVGPDDVTLARTPMTPPEGNLRTRQVVITLRPEGNGTVAIEEEVRGVEAPSYRSTYQAQGVRRERLERRMRELFPGLQMGEPTFENLDDFNAPVRFRFEAEVPQLAIRDGRGLRITPSAMTGLSGALAQSSAREQTLDLGFRSAYREERRVRLPAGFRIQDLPEAGVAESPFGRLTMEVERQGLDVVVRTELLLGEDRIEASRYDAFKAWVGDADRLLRQRLTLMPGRER
ncbi:MAG: DUF3857 domain-containing protein [Sandaracinaceae bacterium]